MKSELGSIFLILGIATVVAAYVIYHYGFSCAVEPAGVCTAMNSIGVAGIVVCLFGVTLYALDFKEPEID